MDVLAAERDGIHSCSRADILSGSLGLWVSGSLGLWVSGFSYIVMWMSSLGGGGPEIGPPREDIHSSFECKPVAFTRGKWIKKIKPPCPFRMGGVTKKKRVGRQNHYKRKCEAPGCTSQAKSNGTELRFCIAHGGGKPCEEPGCTSKACNTAPGKFCSKHGGGQRCTYGNGCNKSASGGGLCAEHTGIARELVLRIKRNRALRAKYLDEILEEQGGACANPHKHCYHIVVGAASSRCPWGDRPLPREAAQLDHKIPLFLGGTDDKNNLQVLCACCHAMKSSEEAHEAAIGL